jgi:hypothetical protein
MSNVIQTVADTISQKPEVGIFGSMLGVALSPIAIISLLSAIFGLCITVITLIIKIMDIYEKIQRKKKANTVLDEDVMIDNKRYRMIADEDEE